MTLIEFLLARITDDEAEADEWQARLDSDVKIPPRLLRGILNPGRVLAELDAKRKLVAEHDPSNPHPPGDRYYAEYSAWHLKVLALPYADHPDYREEWRP